MVAGDGTQVDFAPADVIYVNAGATHPLPHWLDRLKENVTRLYRRDDIPATDCWLSGKGWCLAFR